MDFKLLITTKNAHGGFISWQIVSRDRRRKGGGESQSGFQNFLVSAED